MNGSKINIVHEEYQPDLPPVILLHALTLTKETWDDCAKVIANRTGAKVYWYDARNHGNSGWSKAIGYEMLADDLADFMDSMGIPKAIIVGHSLGGKTGMSFGLKYPERLHSLVIEDISMHSTVSNTKRVICYMDMMKKVLQKIPPTAKLSEAKRFAALFLSGIDPQTLQMDNSTESKECDGVDIPLLKTGERFEWNLNLDALLFALKTDTWGPALSEGVYNGPVLVIYGTKSPHRVLSDKSQLLKHFPKALYQPIEGSHLLHVEQPEIFIKLVCDFIIQQRH